MIQRVYEQAQKANSLDRIIVATDDERIAQNVKSFGGEVVMTSPTHTNGTERCLEVFFELNTAALTSNLVNKSGKKAGFNYDIVFNIQGDEPFINPDDIDKVVALIKTQTFDIATLAKKITNPEDIENPNIVKVVFDLNHKALYFSRHAIPYVRDKITATTPAFYQHIGLYAFKGSTLLKLPQFQQSTLEKAESLEQLRWLENGLTIGVAETENTSISIDTPDDLKKAWYFHER